MNCEAKRKFRWCGLLLLAFTLYTSNFLAAATVTGHITDLAGNPAVGAQVKFKLTNYAGSNVPRCLAGGCLYVNLAPVIATTDVNGNFTQTITENSLIAPVGTLYSVTVSATAYAGSAYSGGLYSIPPGTSDLSTLTPQGGVIPGLSVSISSPLLLNSNTLSIQQANGSQSGYLAASDWTTFESVLGMQPALTVTSPLLLNSNTLSIPQANASQNGFLSSSDWTTFKSGAGLNFNSPLQNSSGTVSCPTCEMTTNKNASNGYAGLSGGFLSASQLPTPANSIAFANPSTIGTTTGGINEAIESFSASGTACGTIMLPAGLVTITSTIGGASVIAGRDGCRFVGQGAPDSNNPGSSGTYIQWAGAAGGTMFSAIGCLYCTFQDFTLDGTSTAGIGFEQTSQPSGYVSAQNKVSNVYIYNVNSTTVNSDGGYGYGIHVGQSGGRQVSESQYDKISIVNADTGVYQDGANTLNIHYSNFYVSNAAVACYDFEAGNAIDDKDTCNGIQTGATADWIVKNGVNFSAKGDYDEQSTSVPDLYAPGVSNTAGGAITLIGGNYGSSCFGCQIMNYTQNGTLTLQGNTFGNNSGYINFAPVGSSSFSIGLLDSSGNKWAETWINFGTSYYSATINDSPMTGGVGPSTVPLGNSVQWWKNAAKHGTMWSNTDLQLLNGEVLAQQVEAMDPTVLASQSLNDTTFADGSQYWSASGGCALSGGTATCSSSSGTLTQTTANMAIAPVANSWYGFTYTIGTLTSQPNLTLSGVPASAVSLQNFTGTHTTYFRTGSSPGNLVINSYATGSVGFNSVSLQQITGGIVNAAQYNVAGSQIAFGNISGTVGASQLPTPTSSTLGGVKSLAQTTHQWINSISTSGVPAASQPACGDLSNAASSCSTDTTNASNIASGTLGAARLPTPTASTLGGVESLAQTTHQWINSISTGGVPAASQPGIADLSDTPSRGQVHAGPSAYGAAAATATFRALVPQDMPAGTLSCAVLDNAICTSSVDAVGNPNFLAAGSGATIDVNGGTTALTYFVAGVYQQINSNLAITASTPGSDTAYFVIVKQDTSNANPVNADLAVTNIVPYYGYAAPTCSSSASSSNPHFWYNLAANISEWCTTSGGSFSAQASLVLGVAVVSSTPTVVAAVAEPYRLNPYRRFELFGDASTAAALTVTSTSTVDGFKQYGFVLVDGSSAVLQHTAETGNTSERGLMVKSQNPVLLINSGVVNVNSLGVTASSVGTGAGAAGHTNAYGLGISGPGGGGGGAGSTNSGGAGGGIYSPFTYAYAYGGGSAGGVGSAGGAGTNANSLAGIGGFKDWTGLAGSEGASGANGAGDGTNNGGQGGTGGGFVAVSAPAILVLSGSSVTANGGAGGNGAAGTAGGGGGGGGGVALLDAGYITNGAGATYTPTATGGAYGNGVSTGGHGGAGGNGTALSIKLW